MCVLIFKNLKIPTPQQTQSFKYKDKLVNAVRGSNGCLFIVRIIHLQYVGKMPKSSLLCQAGGIYRQLSLWFKVPDMNKEYVLHKRY